MSVNQLKAELSTLAVAQHDAQTRLCALAARGAVKNGQWILDKLDDALSGLVPR